MFTLKKIKYIQTGVEICMGKPGAGKSSYAACLARDYLSSGGSVWSNYPILGTKRLDLDSDVMYWDIHDGLVLIDEAGLSMDARNWKNFSDRFVQFFKLHRKYNLRVVVLTQYWDDIDKKVRLVSDHISLVEPGGFLDRWFVTVRDIDISIGISADKQIVQQFNFVGFWGHGVHRHYRLSAYSLFNSFVRPSLPDRGDWPVWKKGDELV